MVSTAAESLSATLRRRQEGREPRALLYDSVGRPRVVPVDAPGRDELIEAAERLIDVCTPE